MTAKELKKLKRSELLEMLLARTEEVERLRAELDEANEKLADRAICLENVGSIAEAALKLNDVFAAADAAVEQYLKNVERITCGDDKLIEPAPADAPAEEKKPEKPTKSKKPKKPRKAKTPANPKDGEAEAPKAESESAEGAE